ncbi:MAG TPA: SRPBCC family protein [Vicinamibacterales bacterium]|nr:SRPBCC family protein [Vicinamibacterales bacterium]
MTVVKPPITVQVVRRFDAAPERVFDAWLDPAKAKRFLFTAPGGEIVRCEIDARVGGTFTIVDRRGSEDIVHTGQYLEIRRPRRLAFTFFVERYSTRPDHVAIDIVPVDSGCELTLIHEMSPDAAEYENQTREGWTMILDGLGAAVD